MRALEEIDANFKIDDGQGEQLQLWNIDQPPFRVYGLKKEAGQYIRLPAAVARKANPGVLELSNHTAGGRVRFVTDSDVVGICARMHHICRMSHFTLCGSAGFDLYDRGRFIGTFRPPKEMEEGFTSVLRFPEHGRHEVLIHFPLYSGVRDLFIGVEPGKTIAEAADYRRELPFVVYGSSITQGGCASRPGNCYANILSRELNTDHVNLGFSGSAKGELPLAEYIASLPQSAFLMDYDANAPDAAYLRATHEPFFLKIREKNQDLPILLLTRPYPWLSDEQKRCRDVILKTFLNAQERGDKRTAFLDMSAVMLNGCGYDGTVDNSHPNDLGFRCMANAVKGALEQLYRP